MRKRYLHGLAIAFVLALGAGSACAQPVDRPRFTAFPDLKPPDDPRAEALFPALPELPADAPVLRKVLRAQAHEGFSYLARIHEVIRIGSWSGGFFFDTVLLASETYTVAAEIEGRLVNRIPWYEERVRKLKELERLTETRVQKGADPPDRLNFVRFYRLQSELDLLTLKDAVARAGGGTPRPLVMRKFDLKLLGPKDEPKPIDLNTGKPTNSQDDFVYGDTAFPELKTRTVRKWNQALNVSEEKDAVPLPRLPVLPAGASTIHKVYHEQVLDGFRDLQSSMPVMPYWIDGALYSFQFLLYFRNSTDTYRTAARLEERLADRVPWYEARVRWLKFAERIETVRVSNGTDPPSQLDAVRFYRYQTEADLLRLKDEVKTVPTSTRPAPLREVSAFKEEWGHFKKLRPTYTAFPDLKKPIIENAATPLPTLPPIAPDAPLVRKILLAQAQEGLEYLEHINRMMQDGTWESRRFVEYVHLATAACPVAAKLENTLVKQVPWSEARIRTLNHIEQFIEGRVETGTDSPDILANVRLVRLRAEAELLILKDEVAKPAPVIISVCQPCPPTCARPRGPLARLFRCR
jgi:hypothetical protein